MELSIKNRPVYRAGNTIYKYCLNDGKYVANDTVEMTIKAGAIFLKVALQQEQITIWALAMPNVEDTTYTFKIVPTGNVTNGLSEYTYLDTVFLADGLVWHVFAK